MRKTNQPKHLSFWLGVIVVLLLSALYWFTIDLTKPAGENGEATKESQFRGPVGEPFITGPTEPPPYNIEQ